MLGHYIKSSGTRGTKMSANADLIKVETYVQQGETIWEAVLHIYWPKCKKNVYFGLFGGAWGDIQWSDWACLAFQLSSYPYLCKCQIRNQSDTKFLGLNSKYKKPGSVVTGMSRARNSRWGMLLYVNEAGIYGGQNKIGVHVYHVGIAIYTW